MIVTSQQASSTLNPNYDNHAQRSQREANRATSKTLIAGGTFRRHIDGYSFQLDPSAIIGYLSTSARLIGE
jgi:hypothetical protein